MKPFTGLSSLRSAHIAILLSCTHVTKIGASVSFVACAESEPTLEAANVHKAIVERWSCRKLGLLFRACRNCFDRRHADLRAEYATVMTCCRLPSAASRSDRVHHKRKHV